MFISVGRAGVRGERSAQLGAAGAPAPDSPGRGWIRRRVNVSAAASRRKSPPELDRLTAAQGESPVTPTKLLIGQILIVFAIVTFGVWGATQWAAAMLAYQPQLGGPWFIVKHFPIYRPWALFGWWYHYEAYAPHVFDKAGALAA